MRPKLAGAFVLIVALMLPATAGAAVRQVETTGNDTGNCISAACQTIQYAAEKAETGDTVDIGSGTFNESVKTPTVLSFVGAGNGATRIHGVDGDEDAGSAAFTLPNGGSLKALRAEGGEGDSYGSPILTGTAGGSAIVFQPLLGLGQHELTVSDVTALGGDGGAGGFPLSGGAGGDGLIASSGEGSKTVSIVDSTLAAGSSAGLSGSSALLLSGGAVAATVSGSLLDGEGGFLGSTAFVGDGATATLETTLVEGGLSGIGVEAATLRIKRSRVESLGTGLSVTAGTAPKAEAIVSDSIVVATEGVAGQAVSGIGFGESKLVSRGSTFVAEGGPSPAVEARASTAEQPTTTTLHNTIAINRDPGGTAPDIIADAATVQADHSNFSSSIVLNGGTGPAPGSGTNVGGDPGFASPDTFALSPSSPLIDRGDPAIVEPGELDFAGNPRSVDGNHDCLAAPDIGALELIGQSSPCPPQKVSDAVPVVSGFAITNKTFAPKGGKKPAKASKVKRGTKFNYSLSEPAQVAIKIERRKKPRKGKARWVKVTSLGGQARTGRASTPFSGIVKGKPVPPGKYRATIVATDSAGQRSTPHQLSFTVVSG